jgi:hypothetical protein
MREPRSFACIPSFGGTAEVSLRFPYISEGQRLVSRIFTSWNQTVVWLRRLDRLMRAA